MREPILKRRTVVREEWVVPREAVDAELDGPDDVEDLNAAGEADDHDLDDDEDEDDED